MNLDLEIRDDELWKLSRQAWINDRHSQLLLRRVFSFCRQREVVEDGDRARQDDGVNLSIAALACRNCEISGNRIVSDEIGWIVHDDRLWVAAWVGLNKAIAEDSPGRIIDGVANVRLVDDQRVVCYDTRVDSDLELSYLSHFWEVLELYFEFNLKLPNICFILSR